jgi:rubrerythrin
LKRKIGETECNTKERIMTLEEAIRNALHYETRIHAVYRRASEETTDKEARRFYRVMAEEEAGHLAYLENRLEEWQRAGRVTAATLTTALPEANRIAEAAGRKVEGRSAASDAARDIERLKLALELETATSDFYREIVGCLPKEDAALFTRFLEIEDGHRTLVQAELDAVEGTGFWFETREFDLEAG